MPPHYDTYSAPRMWYRTVLYIQYLFFALSRVDLCLAPRNSKVQFLTEPPTMTRNAKTIYCSSQVLRDSMYPTLQKWVRYMSQFKRIGWSDFEKVERNQTLKDWTVGTKIQFSNVERKSREESISKRLKVARKEQELLFRMHLTPEGVSNCGKPGWVDT